MKNSPDNKDNMMSVVIVKTNNNKFVIVSTHSNSNMWDIYSGKYFQTHVGHEYDIYLV